MRRSTKRRQFQPPSDLSLWRGRNVSSATSLVWLVLLLPFAAYPDTKRMEAPALPEILTIETVRRIAREQRPELVAARARAHAAAQRPAIVSSLEDPMLYPAIDHWPRGESEFDWSFGVEQRFPLSRVRGHRRRAAQAEADRLRAEVDREALDVELEAIDALLMVYEWRRMVDVWVEQLSLARQLASAAEARYSAARGPQSELLRAEVEVSEKDSLRQSAMAQLGAAEALLNSSLNRPPGAPVPTVSLGTAHRRLPPLASLLEEARDARPELRVREAEQRRAEAEVDVMRSMYSPMAMLRAGPASTMGAGSGWMLMLGVSVPIYRERLRAGVSESEAMTRMARAELAAASRMIEGEVAAARAAVLSAELRHASLRNEVLPRATQSVDSAMAGYAAGEVAQVTLLEASRMLWSMQAEFVMAETNLALSWARLMRATGWSEE